MRPEHRIAWAHKGFLPAKRPQESTGRHRIASIQWSLPSMTVALSLSPSCASAMLFTSVSISQNRTERDSKTRSHLNIFLPPPHWGACNHATSLSHSWRVVILLDNAMLSIVDQDQNRHLESDYNRITRKPSQTTVESPGN